MVSRWETTRKYEKCWTRVDASPSKVDLSFLLCYALQPNKYYLQTIKVSSYDEVDKAYMVVSHGRRIPEIDELP